MKRWFCPDLEFENIYQVTPEFLKARGIKAILSDLDNTIADYDTPVPNEAMCNWIAAFQKEGIGFAIVSNNCRERVSLFCSKLNIPFYWRSAKPLRIQIWRAMRALGATRKNTCFIGDKFLTDVFGARRAGLFTIRVPSIKPRRKGKVK